MCQVTSKSVESLSYFSSFLTGNQLTQAVHCRFKKFEELSNILKTLMKEYLID